MRLVKGKTVLRNIKPSDSESLATQANNIRIWNNVRDRMPHPYSLQNAEEFIDYVLNESKDHIFAIDFNTEFCGVIGLHPQRDVYAKNLEMGYWVGERFWNKGIASSAVALICNFGFEKLGFNRIYASVFEYNKASIKVLVKNGFKKEGVARKSVFKNEQYWDEHLYGKIKSNP